MAKNKSRWIPINFTEIIRQKIKKELNRPQDNEVHQHPLSDEIYEQWRKLPSDQKHFRPYLCDGKVFFVERRKHYYRDMIKLEKA